MFAAKIPSLLALGAFALVGCTRAADKTTTTTKTETTQVGSTAVSESKTTVDTPQGDRTARTNTYVGTVTQFTQGESIEVMTGNNDKHAFDLDGKSDVITIDSRVAVGSKVTLVEEKGEKDFHRITVTIAPPV